ncbi:olfactory receptor 5B21-like [Lacerta agilis]|uniref:olfactory receptor 5B21-like n=1 Tax=Lacerta agilis TaxID=80427 RepID=UPI0014191192|nr:olfactory receptor 5B21-like [Lacerta agilis]
MGRAGWRNQTTVTEFILLGFEDLPKLQGLFFLVFLIIYLVTLCGNLLITVLIVTDRCLHTPMYFFLGNLSCLEICYSSAVLPRMLASFLTGLKEISFAGCLVQYYVFACLAGTECYLLSAMSYDRYLAVCKPLHYASLMNGQLCFQLSAGSWVCGFLVSTITTISMSWLFFCGPNEIDHYICDLKAMLKLSCSDTYWVELIYIVFACTFTLPPFLLTMTSYIYIIATILRISSTTGRKKTFSTCSSHLLVVSLFYGTLIMVYMVPRVSILRHLRKVFSLFYTVLTPMVNPLIYSLRNKDVNEALGRILGRCPPFTMPLKIQFGKLKPFS